MQYVSIVLLKMFMTLATNVYDTRNKCLWH